MLRVALGAHDATWETSQVDPLALKMTSATINRPDGLTARSPNGFLLLSIPLTGSRGIPLNMHDKTKSTLDRLPVRLLTPGTRNICVRCIVVRARMVC